MTTPTPQKPPPIIDQKILKNALEIIYHTGLLKNEVVKLSIADVMQNGIIVRQIQSVSGTYPKGFVKDPVTVLPKASTLLKEHIKYLQSNGLSISPKSPLFHVAKTNERYDESKLWSFLSEYSPYNRYERHREAGILNFCWERSKAMSNKQQIINAAHRFSRYSNIKRTEKLVEEGISQDPIQYEKAYRDSFSAAGWLINLQKTRQHKVKQYLPKLQRSFDLLFDRDKKTLLNIVNKKLQERKKKLVQRENLLVIEEITEIRISLKAIKGKKRRKFN